MTARGGLSSSFIFLRASIVASEQRAWTRKQRVLSLFYFPPGAAASGGGGGGGSAFVWRIDSRRVKDAV